MKEKLRVLTSREWTHTYCREWAEVERKFRDAPNRLEHVSEVEARQRLMLFPNLERLIRGRRILEIGCAKGATLKRFQRMDAEVTGIDWKEEPRMPEVVRGDFMTHPFPQPFDAIFAFGVFEARALYATQCLQRDETDTELAGKNTPEKMLSRLRELLVRDGFCLFQTYVFPLVFTPEMARREGLVLRTYKRALDCSRYGSGGENVDIVMRPSFYHVITASK